MKFSKLVLFDIDGTLIRGRYPGSKGRFTYILKKYLDDEMEIDWNKFDGKPDRAIFKYFLKAKGISEEMMEKKLPEVFEDAYDYMAKNIKPDYKERLIKEAIVLIKKLLLQKNIFIGLLTGNQRDVAHLKIKTVGLTNFFKFGLYGDEADDRNELAKLVFKKAKNFFGLDFLAKNIYIIGDTPHDVNCGKFIAAKTIAVTTGSFSKEELKKTEADLMVESLADKKILKFILKDE